MEYPNGNWAEVIRHVPKEITKIGRECLKGITLQSGGKWKLKINKQCDV